MYFKCVTFEQGLLDKGEKGKKEKKRETERERKEGNKTKKEKRVDWEKNTPLFLFLAIVS